jgi:recombination protein RecA
MAKKKEEKENFAEVLSRLNKTYGEGAIMKLTDKCKDDYDVISTGSIALDYEVLGVGGIVKGKLYELMGWEGTGKSTVCGHLTANCQRDGGMVVYIDGEHAVDKNYFKALGVDINKMYLSQPSNGEEGFNIAMEMIKTGEVDLVIIDSDSSLMPKKVVDGEVGDSAIGRKASLNSNAYPKLKNRLVETNTAMVVISQFREKIGVMFGDPRTTQGGHALKFYSDCRMEIAKSLNKDGTEVIGNITRVKTLKNKTYPPYKNCEFIISFGIGIDRKLELMDLAHAVSLGRKYGKTYTFNDVKYDLIEFMVKLEDEAFFQELRTQVVDRLLNGIPEES